MFKKSYTSAVIDWVINYSYLSLLILLHFNYVNNARELCIQYLLYTQCNNYNIVLLQFVILLSCIICLVWQHWLVTELSVCVYYFSVFWPVECCYCEREDGGRSRRSGNSGFRPFGRNHNRQIHGKFEKKVGGNNYTVVLFFNITECYEHACFDQRNSMKRACRDRWLVKLTIHWITIQKRLNFN